MSVGEASIGRPPESHPAVPFGHRSASRRTWARRDPRGFECVASISVGTARSCRHDTTTTQRTTVQRLSRFSRATF